MYTNHICCLLSGRRISMHVCPKCNHELSDDMNICPNCGCSLKSEKDLPKRTVKVRVKKKEEPANKDVLVPNALESNQVSESSSITETDANSSITGKPILIGLGAIILALLIALIVSTSNSNKHTSEQLSTSISETSSPTTSTTTTTTTSTTVATLMSDTEYYYDKVCSLDINDLQARNSSSLGTLYYYKDLPIQTEDEEWLNTSWNKDKSLNQGCIYRSVAGVLEGFSYGFNSGSAYSKIVCGIQTNSRSEFEPYAANASSFISKEDSSNKLLRKLESTSCVHGDFDYANNHYHFVIADIQKCAQEMGITEEMLGYCFGVFAEYAADIVFDGNTCTIDRQI